MQDPATTEPTTQSGLFLGRLAAFLLLIVGLFLLVGTDSARAEALLDEVVETLPVEQVVETLPVDEVVEDTPLEPVVDVVEPSPEPEPQPEAEPAATRTPSPPTSEAPADEPAALEETVSVVAEVVTGVTGGTAVEPDEAAGLPELVEPVADAVSTVVPAPEIEATEAPNLIDSVTKPVADLEQVLTPVVDNVSRSVPPHLTNEIVPVVSGVVDAVSGTVVSLVGTVDPALDQVIGMLPPVLESVLTPVPALVDGTVSGLIDTVDRLLPPPDSPRTPEPALPIVGGPDTGQGSTAPDEVAGVPPIGSPTKVLDPVESPLHPVPIRPEGSTLAPTGAAPSEAAPAVPAMSVDSGGQPAAEEGRYPDSGSGDWVRGLSLARSAASSSGFGPALGLLAVLVLTGLAVPRLSRWLRLQPVLWHPNALAVAIERPG